MASYVVFNGITRYAPGGITKITADALAPVTPGINGIVALVGEAEGGEPGVLVSVDDSSRIREFFRDGALADAVNIAFSPSNDPRIPGGASTVICYKTNNSTQASTILPGAAAVRAVDSVVTGGTGSTLVDSTLVGGSNNDQFNGMWIVLRPNTATQEVKLVSDYDASTGTFSVGSAWSSNPTASDLYLVLSDTVPLVGEVTTGGTTTTVPVLNASFIVDEHADRWVKLYPALGPAVMRKIISNTTNTLTVAPALSQAPVSGTTYLEILPKSIEIISRDYGVHTNGITVDIATAVSGAKIATVSFDGVDHVSPEIGNFPFLKLLFKGGPVVVSDVTASGSTTTVVNLVTGGLTVDAHVGQQLYVDGEYTTVVSNTANTITVSPALSSAPGSGEAVEIRSTTNAYGLLNGSNGAATSLVTFTGVSGADLNVAFTPGMTLRQLVNTVNLNVNYLAVVPNGINPDTTLVKDFDFGAATQIDILVSPSLTSEGFHQDTAQLVNYFNQISELVTAVRASDGTYDGALTAGDIEDPLPLSGGSRGTSTNASFQAGLDAVLSVRANHVVPLIDQDLINEGFGSTATVASVAAQLKDHVVAARGAVGSERGGYIGFQGSKSAIIAQAAAINDMDVALLCQNPSFVNLSGSLQEFGPRMLAVAAAGCRAGMIEIGEALTNKIIKTGSLTNDGSWDPNDLTDGNDMIKAGVLFGHVDDTNTVRWVRDLTTWIADNNLAYSEGSIRDVCRFIAYNLRKTLVDRYVGRKAAPATIRNIKNTAITYLEQTRTDGLIVDSTDPNTGATTYAYHSMKLTASGDTVKLCVGFFPVPSINFILNDLSLGIATQSL